MLGEAVVVKFCIRHGISSMVAVGRCYIPSQQFVCNNYVFVSASGSMQQPRMPATGGYATPESLMFNFRFCSLSNIRDASPSRCCTGPSRSFGQGKATSGDLCLQVSSSSLPSLNGCKSSTCKAGCRRLEDNWPITGSTKIGKWNFAGSCRRTRCTLHSKACLGGATIRVRLAPIRGKWLLAY